MDRAARPPRLQFLAGRGAPEGLWRRTTLGEIPQRRSGVGNSPRPRRARRRRRARTGSGAAASRSARAPARARSTVARRRRRHRHPRIRSRRPSALSTTASCCRKPRAARPGSTRTRCWWRPRSAASDYRDHLRLSAHRAALAARNAVRERRRSCSNASATDMLAWGWREHSPTKPAHVLHQAHRFREQRALSSKAKAARCGHVDIPLDADSLHRRRLADPHSAQRLAARRTHAIRPARCW